MLYSPFKIPVNFTPQQLFWGMTVEGDDDAYGFRRSLSGDQLVAPNIIRTITGFIASPRGSIAKYSYNDFLMISNSTATGAGYAGIGTAGGTGSGALYSDSSLFSDFTFDDAGHIYVTGGALGLAVMDIPGFTNRTEYSWTSGEWLRGQIAWVPGINKLVITDLTPDDSNPFSLGKSSLIGDIETDLYIEAGESNGVVVVDAENAFYIYTNATSEINIYPFNPTTMVGAGTNTGITDPYRGRATDPTGNLYLLTSTDIYKFDADVNLITQQPINTTTFGTTNHLTSDQFGNVYVTCQKGIIIFDYDLNVNATLLEEGYEFAASLGDFEPIGYKTNW